MNVENIYTDIISNGIDIKDGFVSYLFHYTPQNNNKECLNCNYLEDIKTKLKENINQFLPISNDLNLILSKIFNNESSICLEFYDFLDIKHNIKINADIFEKCIEKNTTMFDYLINHYQYNSDYGCLIYSQNSDLAFFYGEDLYDSLKSLNYWQSFHLLVINEQNKTNIDELLIEKFKIFKTNISCIGNHNFGKNLYQIIFENDLLKE